MTGAILDSHCHAWERWPYDPAVPDELTRATAEQLVFNMDVHGVGRALVVCAAIERNPDNLAYVAAACARYTGRLLVVADFDCTWSDTYHRPGAPARLEALCDRYAPAGFAHYLRDDNDGWLAGAEADEVFAIAAQRRLIVSLGAGPSWQADLRRLAGRHPGVPVLCQSLGGIWVHDGRADGLGEVLASAAVPSIHIKLAGCHYACPDGWDYPWPAVLDAVARLHDAYGPHRLCWGSDFPAGGRYCTYRQSLEVARRHCPFIAPEDLTGVLGGNLARLLAPAPSPV